MVDKKSLPMGIDDFAKLREDGFYYVDKTGMIIELLRGWGEVNLFTRPRRFGKTLNMSMLKCFFEPDTDKSIFDGLAISKEKELCEAYMGKYPVLNFSLKQVQGLNYENAELQMWTAVKFEAMRYDHLQDSTRLSQRDKDTMMALSMGIGNLQGSILQMSKILYTHYGQKVIILIDEYDVPLQKAEQTGFYREMVSLISQMFSYGMKTNPYMKFAVVTGCLRVSKESIFTGFNNPKMHTIIDKEYDEWFGFTDKEVQEMLAYYGQSEYYDLTKQWYDGYLFGSEHIYCPWDVISWVNQLVRNEDRIPRAFWANTGGTQMIRRFAEMADDETRGQLGRLIDGGSVWKELNLELTYDELDSDVENLWSMLFMTGYLTMKGRSEEGEFELVIPNKEIQKLLQGIVNRWFRDRVMKDKSGIQIFFDALDAVDAEKVEACLNAYLLDAISYLDGGKLRDKENIYHGMMLGMLQTREGWGVRSNREAGEGRLDVVTYSKWGDRAIIFEFKYVKEYRELEEAARKALEQIDVRKYDEYFDVDAVKEITHIGIAFCKKRCKVMIEKDRPRNGSAV